MRNIEQQLARFEPATLILNYFGEAVDRRPEDMSCLFQYEKFIVNSD